MDIDGKDFGYAALQEMRKILAPVAPQPMANTMPLEGVEALVVEKRDQIALGRRITRSDSDEIGRRRGDGAGLPMECWCAASHRPQLVTHEK
jgi:hypothetical protein